MEVVSTHKGLPLSIKVVHAAGTAVSGKQSCIDIPAQKQVICGGRFGLCDFTELDLVRHRVQKGLAERDIVAFAGQVQRNDFQTDYPNVRFVSYVQHDDVSVECFIGDRLSIHTVVPVRTNYHAQPASTASGGATTVSASGTAQVPARPGLVSL